MQSKQIFILILALACFASGVAMYFIGKDSSNLSELQSYWWTPMPLGLVLLATAFKKK
ncbi:MAG: hypothetical protein ACI837_001263 [Crocinitomicaceae bacterium]|jgi:hypothetical protein